MVKAMEKKVVMNLLRCMRDRALKWFLAVIGILQGGSAATLQYIRCSPL